MKLTGQVTSHLGATALTRSPSRATPEWRISPPAIATITACVGIEHPRGSWMLREQLDLIIWDQISGDRPGYFPQLEAACNDWHNFSLPGYPYKPDLLCHWWDSWHGGARQTVNYYKKAVPPLSAGVLARTYNCTATSFCTASSNQSLLVQYSEIHLNYAAVDNLSTAKRRFMFAHETGHTLGLWHHSSVLMNASVLSSPVGPTSTDYGSLPPCSGASTTWGIRCVFKFSL
jgi:hypothetical protein